MGIWSLLLLGWWVLKSPFVGLADNGDWDRYSCAVGLSGRVRFDSLPETLVPGSCPAYDYRSTFTPFLRALAAIDTSVFGAVHLSHLALFWCVVVSAGWGWFAIELGRATNRPLMSIVVSSGLVLVSSDVIFTSYFGSVYAEAMIVGLLPALAAVLVRAVRAELLDRLTVGSAAAVLVALTAAKPSMALTAPLFVAVVLVARRDRVEWLRAAIALAAALGLCLFSATAIADPNFTEWNTYNLAFTAVVPESGQPSEALRATGLDRSEAADLERFVGVPFGPQVTESWDDPSLVAFRSAGRPAVLRALGTHPDAGVRMLRRGVRTLGELRLDYLANHTGRRSTDTGLRLADRPHPADAVLDGVTMIWWLVPLSWVALLVVFGRRLWRAQAAPGAGRAGPALVIFAVAFAAGQTVMALADGYYELAKHLAVAGEATALVVTGLAVWGAGNAVQRLVDTERGTDPPSWGRGPTSPCRLDP